MDRELQQALNAIQAGADPQAVASRMSTDMHRQALAAVQAGADPAAVSQRLQQQSRAGDRGFTFSDAARMAAQGLTFGFGDEIAGAASAVRGGSYTEARDASRARLERLREQHPVAATASEVVGGLAFPAGTIGTALRGGAAAARAAGAATRGAQVARAARQAATPGAAYGALYGLGEAEGDPGELASASTLAREATINAAVGGAMGGLFGAGVGAVQSRGRGLFSDAVEGAFRDLGPEDVAQPTRGPVQRERIPYRSRDPEPVDPMSALAAGIRRNRAWEAAQEAPLGPSAILRPNDPTPSGRPAALALERGPQPVDILGPDGSPARRTAGPSVAPGAHLGGGEVRRPPVEAEPMSQLEVALRRLQGIEDAEMAEGFRLQGEARSQAAQRLNREREDVERRVQGLLGIEEQNPGIAGPSAGGLLGPHIVPGRTISGQRVTPETGGLLGSSPTPAPASAPAPAAPTASVYGGTTSAARYGGSRARQLRDIEEGMRQEGLWMRLMRSGSDDEVASIMQEVSDTDAAKFLADLYAAPGDNPRVRKALEAKVGGR